MNQENFNKILFSQEKIQNIVRQLGKEIHTHYAKSNKDLLLVGLLKGSFIFMADLVRCINMPLKIDFMKVSSYGDEAVSSENISIKLDIDSTIENCDVLVVEDIIDTGLTLNKVLFSLKEQNPYSLKVCTLLNKPSRRKTLVTIDFCGIEIPDEFVCGYGLDFAQKYRNLPYIAVLKQ